MKLETTAGMLKAALDAVRPAVHPRITIPILSMVKFDGRTIEATDLDITITVTLPARTARGALCIPYRPLAALIAHVPQNDVVTIEGGTAESPNVVISFGTSSYDLPALAVDDFPKIDLGRMNPIKVDGDGLKRALNYVAPSISTEETRYYLNGVYLDDTLAVATDGHRLAAHPLGFGVGEAKGIIPCPAVKVLLGMPAATNMLIDAEKKRFVINAPGISLTGKLIDGTFPDWRRIVPKFENDFRVFTADRAQLRQILTRLSALDGSSRMVTIAWQDDVLAAVVRGMDHGTFGRERMDIPPDMVGGGGLFAVNIRYFLAALRLINRELVEIKVQERGAPMMLRGEGDAFMIVMPMLSDDVTDKAVSAILTDAATRKLTEVAA